MIIKNQKKVIKKESEREKRKGDRGSKGRSTPTKESSNSQDRRGGGDRPLQKVGQGKCQEAEKGPSRKRQRISSWEKRNLHPKLSKHQKKAKEKKKKKEGGKCVRGTSLIRDEEIYPGSALYQLFEY